MVKLRKVELKGFRGARFLFSIDLGKKFSSIAIFGENASGKSTITDGIEWFFYDRVKHLWKEDCEEEALRHIALESKDLTEVTLEFDDQKLNGRKTLDSGLKTGWMDKNPEFENFIEQSMAERLVLRNAYLQDFVLQTKSQKRDEIAKIVGYDTVTAFRETIQRTLTRTSGEMAYAAAKEGLERSRGRLLKKFSKVPRNSAECFKLANDFVAKFGLPTRISDVKSYQECLQALKTRITDPKKGEKRSALQSLKTTLDEFKTSITDIQNLIDGFLTPYKALIRNVDKLRAVDLVGFLSKGKELIDKGRVEGERCPFCLKSVPNTAHLLQEIAKRIAEYEEASEEHETLRKSRDSLVRRLRSMSAEARDRSGQVITLGVSQELGDLLKKYETYTNSFSDAIGRRFGRLEPVEEAKDHGKYVGELLPRIDEGMATAERMMTELQVKAEEGALIQARDDLILLQENFRDAQHFAKTKALYEIQIRGLSVILEEFIKVQSTVLQNVLNVMSEDISDYYLYLHPDEEVDKIWLNILGEQGVEFMYSFRGREVHPPRKYLSESHLNSLGIAIFLASVKLFNERNGFFVLDDIVTSFDISHRLRLLRLLKEKFSDYQILLLTHEAFWFEMIKKEMPAATWQFSEVDWSYERGIEIKRAVKDQKEVIEVKRSQGHDVGNDVRKLLEMVFKEIAFHLGVKLQFRFNETNERRDVGELLSEVLGTVNRKGPSIKDDPIWQRLQTCSFIATTTSHHPGAQIGEGEIDTILVDVGQLEGLFLCGNCNGYVSLKKYSQKDKKVYCSCGKKGLEWKD